MLLAIVSTLIIGFFLLLLYFHCLAKQRQEYIITERQKRRKHYNKAPVFTTIMATKEEVCTGSFKKFECQVVAFPLPEISWYKDNVEITCNKRYKFAFQNGVCSCLIEDITARDQGLYKCEAVNSEGVAYTSAYLLVKDRSVVQSSDGEKTHEEIFCKNQLPKNSKSNLTFEESLTNKENEPPDRAFSNIDDIQRKMEEDMTFEGKMKADDITDHSKEVTPKEITEKTEDKVISNLPADGTEFDSYMAGAKGKQLHVAEEQVEPFRIVNVQMQPTDVGDQQRENGSKIKTEIESGENMKEDGNKNGAKNETHGDDQKYKIGNETRTEDEGKDKTKQEIKSLRNEEKQKQEIEEFENETEKTQKRNVDEKAQTLNEKQSIKKDKKAQTNIKENENRSGDNLKENAISTEKGNEESLGMITDENLQDDRTTQNDAKENTNLENVSKSQGAKKKLIEEEGLKEEDDDVQNGQKDEPDKRIKDERKTIEKNEGSEDEKLNKENYLQLINDSKLNTNAKVLDDKQEDELRLTEKEPNNTTKTKEQNNTDKLEDIKKDEKRQLKNRLENEKTEQTDTSRGGDYTETVPEGELSVEKAMVADGSIGGNKSILPCKHSGEVDVSIKVDEVTSPLFIKKPDNIFTTEGETIKIHCKISGIPQPEVLWFKSGEPVKENAKYSIIAENERYSLVVKDVEIGDAGKYSVAAINSEGKICYSLNVDVKGKGKTKKNKENEKKQAVQTEVMPPEFLHKPTSQTATEFDPVKIFCRVSGYPPPDVSWFKEGKPLRLGVGFNTCSDGDSHYLEISRSSLLDAGEYTCTASNEEGAVFCTLKLTIEGLTEVDSSASTDHDYILEKISPNIAAELEKIMDESTDEELLKEYVVNTDFTDTLKGIELVVGDIVELLERTTPKSCLVRLQKNKETVCTVPSILMTPKDGQLKKTKVKEVANGKELPPPLSPGQQDMRRRGKLSRSPSKKLSSTEIDSSDDDDKRGKVEVKPTKSLLKAYPVYVAVADFIPEDSLDNYLHLKEGQFVHVCDSKNIERWLSKTKPSKLNPAKQGWFPPGFLEKKDGPGIKRNSHEKFREEVIQCTNKKQESMIKRRYALTELLETERDYIRGLGHIMDNYTALFNEQDLPQSLKGQNDVVFANLTDIYNFHNDVFITELMNCTCDPGLIGESFLRWADRFEEYIPFLKKRPLAEQLLSLDSHTGFLKGYERKCQIDGTLLNSLDAPLNHLRKCGAILKDFLKYTNRAQVETKPLADAILMLAKVAQTAEDKVHLDSIEGYHGDINKLGPVIRHDVFGVWDTMPNSRGKDRHCFLFKDKLLVVKSKKMEDISDLPAYTFKRLVDLENVQINELVLDDERFELWYAEPTSEKLTFEARDVHAKQAWVMDIRDLLKTMGIDDTDLPLDKVPDVDKPVTSSMLSEKRKYSQNMKHSADGKDEVDITTDSDSKQYATAGDESESYHTAPEGDDSLAKPVILKMLQNVNCDVGIDAIFECTVLGKPSLSITWVKDDIQIQQTEKYNIDMTPDDVYRLIVTNTEAKDSGKYTMLASNNHGSVNSSALLAVSLTPEKSEAPKVVKGLEKSKEIEAGTEFKCITKITGSPTPDLKWLKDGKELKMNDHYHQVNEKEDYSLILDKSDKNDNATYTCKASNKLGTVETSIRLVVKEKEIIPTVTKQPQKSKTCDEGTELKLSVSLSGNPQPDVTWLKDGTAVKLSEGVKSCSDGEVHTLTIPKTKPEDSGEYTCQAKNKMGQVETQTTVEIKKKPEAPKIVKGLEKSKEIEAGTQFKCITKITGNPTPYIKWLKDGKELKLNDHYRLVNDKEDYYLILDKSDKNHNATYTCKASNKLGTVETSIKLVVNEKEIIPTVTKQPEKSKTCDEGTELKLSVSLSGNPQPEVTWLKDGKAVKLSEGVKSRSEGELHTLTIPKTKPEDSGEYTCQAKNKMGQVETQTKVEIKKKEIIPTVTKQPQKSKTCDEGTELKLSVSLSGNPPPEVTWLKDGEAVKLSEGVKSCSDGEVHTLTIPKTKSEDSGQYTCQAKNKIGQVETKTKVEIKKKEVIPTVTKQPQKSKTCDEGTELKLSVSLSGNPHPEVTWLKDGKAVKLSEGVKSCSDGEVHTLTIPKTKPEDSGEYTCQAKNKMGQVETQTTVVIKKKSEAPKIVKGLEKSKEIEAGTEFKCITKITGNPTPDIKWLKDGKELKLNDHYHLVNDKEDYSLILDKSDKNDNATYTCKASNKLGTVETSIKLVVNEKEVIPTVTKQPQKSKTCDEGTELKLSVSLSGNPHPEVTWLKDGKAVKLSEGVKSCSEGEVHTLTIPKTKPEDSGEYTCQAKNKMGQVETQTKVEIKKKPEAPKIVKGLEKSKEIESGIGFKFITKITGNPTPNVKWLKDGKDLKTNDHYHIVNDKDDYSLILDKSDKNDNAAYTCKASNKLGTVETSIKLVVKEKEVIPTVTKHPQKTKTCDEGSELKLSVSLSGNPQPEVTWLKDGEAVKLSEGVKSCRDGEVHTLTIPKTKPGDSGEYTCRAKNKIGVAQAQTKVEINSKVEKMGSCAPEVLSHHESVQAYEGEALELIVKVKAEPEPSISWYVDGHKLKPSDDILMEFDGENISFIINEVFPEDTGVYTCKLENSIGKAEVSTDVTIKDRRKVIQNSGAPKLWIPLEDLKIKESKIACFECSVTSNQPTNIYWLHEDEQIMPTERIEMFEDGDFLGINIYETTENDAGKYTCVVRNDDGEVSSSAKLTVLGIKKEIVGYEPMITWRLKDQEAIIGETIRFDCRFTSDPDPDIQWLKDNAKLEPNKKYEFEHKEGNFALVIHDLKADDEGMYKCILTNAIGSTSCSAGLLVEESRFHAETKSPEPSDATALPRRDSVSPESRKIQKALMKEKGKKKSKSVEIEDEISRISAGETLLAKSEPREYEEFEEADTGVPLAPKAVHDAPTIHDLSKTSLTLSWPESIMPSYAKKLKVVYDVEFREPPSKDWKTIASGLDDTAYHISDIKPDREYRYRIRAVNEIGKSEPSLHAVVPRRAGPPKLPNVKPRYKEVGAEEIELFWDKTKPEKGYIETDVSYNLEVRKPPSKEWKMLASNISNNSIKTKMQPDEDYQIRVTAVNEWGASDPTLAVMIPRRIDKFRPDFSRQKPDYKLRDGTNVELNWQPARLPYGAPPGLVINYTIEECQFPNHDFKTLAQDLCDTSYIIKKVMPDIDYKYRVTATTKYASSDPSQPVSVFRKPAKNVPIPPKETPTMLPVETNAIYLCWHAAHLPPGVDTEITYNVYQKEFLSEEWHRIASLLPDTSCTVRGLNPETDYMFRIYAVNDNGISEAYPPFALYQIPGYDDAARKQPDDIPSRPTAKKIGNNSVKLDWQPSLPPVGTKAPVWYTVEEKDAGSSLWHKVAEKVEETSYVLEDLIIDKDYAFRVLAENDYGKSNPSPAVKVQCKGKEGVLPTPVQDKPEVKILDPTTARLKWLAPYSRSDESKPTSYAIEICDWGSEIGRWETLVSGVEETSFTLKDLDAKSDYMVRIVSENQTGVSAPTPEVRIVQNLAPNPIKEKPSVTDINPTSVKLSWVKPYSSKSMNAPTHYAIEIADNVDMNWQVLVDKLTDTSFTLNDLMPDVNYQFRIVAKNDYGKSEPSLAVKVLKKSSQLVPEGLREKPTLLETGPNSINLSWGSPRTSSYSLPQTYTVEFREGALGKWKKLESSLEDTFFIANDLRPDKDYAFRILSDNEFGSSEPSPAAVRPAFKDLKPYPIRGKPTVEEFGPRSIGLSWDTPKILPEGDFFYEIEVKEAGTQVWKTLVTDLENPVYKIENHRPDVDYMYRILVVNNYGKSDPSPAVTKYGLQDALLPTISKDKPSVNELGPSAIELSWKPALCYGSETPITYVIEMKEGQSGRWRQLVSDIKDNFYKINNLGYEKDYVFRVRASNKYGIGDPTHSVTAYRSKSAYFPDPISHQPQLSVHSPTSATLMWNEPKQPSHLKDLPFMYIVETKEHPSRDWKEVSRNIEDLSYDLNRLQPSKEYSFRVLVENEYGVSEPSPHVNLSRKAADYVPSAPKEKPRLSDIRPDTLRLSWDKVENPAMASNSPTKYSIEYRDAKFKWKILKDDLEETTCVVTAAADTEHVFRVRAKNAFGIGDSSRHVCVPKRLVIPEPVPDKPFLMELAPDTVKLSWRSPKSAYLSDLHTSPYTYILEYRELPNDKWKKLIGALKETTFTIRDLEREKDYMFRVKTQNDFGVSEPSTHVSRTKRPDYESIRRSRSRSREPSPWRLPGEPRTDIAPQFSGRESDIIYGVHGLPVKLRCHLKASPDPKIKWYHGDREVDLGGRYNAFKEGKDEYRLEINKMVASDVGTYHISAENVLGVANLYFKLEIADPPIFLEPMKDTTLRCWSRGKMDCRVDGHPYPEVKFFKEWRLMVLTSRVKATRSEHDYWSLYFDNTISADEGMYICVAENIAGKAYCIANLKIEEKPPPTNVQFRPTHISDFYYVLDEIARGSHGVIRRVVEKSTGVEFAAKFLRSRDENQKSELKSEVDLMSLLDHRHIIRLIDAFEMKKNVVLVMELLTGEELLDYIVQRDRLTESEVAFYVRQVLEALEHMHSKGVVHLDLKPENLRLATAGSDDSIKLLDFGFSRRLYKNKDTYSDLGSPEFVSPEILNKQPISHCTDAWGVGVLTYILLSGISPFHANSERETLLKIKDGNWKFDNDAFENTTDEAKDFIKRLLVNDQRKRQTVKQCFEHPWLQVSEQRGQGIKINVDRHGIFTSRRKFLLSQNTVKNVVIHRKMSLIMAQPPIPSINIPEVDLPELDDSFDRSCSTVTASRLSPASPTGIVLTPGTSRASSMEPSESGDSIDSREGEEDCPMEDWIHQYYKTSHLQSSQLDKLGIQDFFGNELGMLTPKSPFKKLSDTDDLEEDKPKRRVGARKIRKISYNETEAAIGADGEPPVFTETLKDQAYNVGEDVTLSCQVAGNPAPHVNWYRNDEPLWDGERVRIIHSKESGHTSLTIRNTLPHDYGVYKCVAMGNNAVNAMTKARLFCGDAPRRPGRPIVQQVSATEAILLWDEPEFDGNGHIISYRVDFRVNNGGDRWTIATYTIDELALVRELKPNTVYRFRVCCRNKFGTSPYSWASIEVRTKPEGSSRLKIDRETKRILLRSQRTTIEDSDDDDDITPTGSRRASLSSCSTIGSEYSGVSLQNIDPQNSYDFEGQIEGGHFNVVVNCRNKVTKKACIAKILGFDSGTRNSVLREYDILNNLHHDRIVQLIDAILTNKQLILIFEKLNGEEVTRALSFKTRYNEETVCRIIRQVVAALQYLHNYGVVHLNIQPGNVVLVSRRRLDLKVIDFSCAQNITNEEGKSFGMIGMPEFMAPEMINGELVGCAADMWNVGVLTFILLSGESPFLGSSDCVTYENIKHLRYDAEQLYGHITKPALRFMYYLMKTNPRERLHLDECTESRWLSLSESMVKKRQSATFITTKLRNFQEQYINRRRAMGTPSEDFLGSYAHIKRASSVDSDV